MLAENITTLTEVNMTHCPTVLKLLALSANFILDFTYDILSTYASCVSVNLKWKLLSH